MGEEPNDLGLGQLARVTLVVEEDVTACPVDEVMGHGRRVAVGDGCLVELVEQARRLGRKGGDDIHGGRSCRPGWAGRGRSVHLDTMDCNKKTDEIGPRVLQEPRLDGQMLGWRNRERT